MGGACSLSDPYFKNLHPEEAWWLGFRLDITSEAVEQFVYNWIGYQLSDDEVCRRHAFQH